MPLVFKKGFDEYRASQNPYISKLSQDVLARLSNPSSAFYEQKMKTAERLQSEYVRMEKHREQVIDSGEVIDDNIIYPIRNIADMHTANHRMKRIITAHPYLAEWERRNKFVYPGYKSNFSGLIKEDNPIWCSVHSGILVEEDDGEYWAHEYICSETTEIDELTHDEQVMALETYETIDRALEDGSDIHNEIFCNSDFKIYQG